MKDFVVLGGEKTNPIQSQSKPILFSPQIYLGVERRFEKTKPILKNQNWRKYL